MNYLFVILVFELFLFLHLVLIVTVLNQLLLLIPTNILALLALTVRNIPSYSYPSSYKLTNSSFIKSLTSEYYELTLVIHLNQQLELIISQKNTLIKFKITTNSNLTNILINSTTNHLNVNTVTH